MIALELLHYSFCLTCGVISACLIFDPGKHFFSSVTSCTVASEYLAVESIPLLGRTSAINLMFTFIRLRMDVLPEWSQHG